MNIPLMVSDYDKETGTIVVSYDNTFFYNVIYDEETCYIRFVFNSNRIKSFIETKQEDFVYEVVYKYVSKALVVNVDAGIELPPPTTYKMTSSTLVDSGRNTSGFAIFTIIREGVRKLELEWDYLSAEDYEALMDAVDSSFQANYEYYDTILGETQGKVFYAGDRTGVSAVQALDNNGKIQGYQNVKISLVEV